MAEAKSGLGAADVDREAREWLWAAIQLAAESVAGSCAVYTTRAVDKAHQITGRHRLPGPDTARTWQLLELLSMLSILAKADRINTGAAVNVFGKTGPIEFVQAGRAQYLWSQPTLTGLETALGGRPDLLVTTSSDAPSPQTVVRIVESKCRKDLGVQDVRAEFGKAHDLRVKSYFIWSYYMPAQRLVDGARKLAIDLTGIGFDTDRRSLLAAPENLFSFFSSTLEESRKAERFSKMLLQAGQEASAKLLSP